MSDRTEGRERRQYPQEFQFKAVRLADSIGINAAAHRLGMPRATMGDSAGVNEPDKTSLVFLGYLSTDKPLVDDLAAFLARHLSEQPLPSLRACLAIALTRRFFKPVWNERDPVRFKNGNAWMDRMIPGGTKGTTVRGTEIAGRAAMALTPASGGGSRRLLYFHGGGFVVHLPGMYRKFVGHLCRTLDATAIVPDYRLAPEHPFPAAHNDCLAAYRAVIAEGTDPQQLLIAGDSAGGHLTFSILMAATAEGLPMAACAVTFSPATSLAAPLASEKENAAHDPLISDRTLAWLRQQYLQGADATDVRASPLFGDVANLPPVRIDVGGIETLRDHGLEMAEKIRAAGGEVEVKLWPGMQHVFPAVGWLPESRACLEEVAAFVDRHMPR